MRSVAPDFLYLPGEARDTRSTHLTHATHRKEGNDSSANDSSSNDSSSANDAKSSTSTKGTKKRTRSLWCRTRHALKPDNACGSIPEDTVPTTHRKERGKGHVNAQGTVQNKGKKGKQNQKRITGRPASLDALNKYVEILPATSTLRRPQDRKWTSQAWSSSLDALTSMLSSTPFPATGIEHTTDACSQEEGQEDIYCTVRAFGQDAYQRASGDAPDHAVDLELHEILAEFEPRLDLPLARPASHKMAQLSDVENSRC